MNAKETLNKVRTLLGMDISLEQAKMENGTIVEAESFEPGKEIFIVSPEGEERVAIPVGEYEMEDGKMLIVQEEGVIGEIKEAEAKEEEVPEEVAEPEMEAQKPEPKKVVESVSKELFFSEIEKLKKEITELKAQKEELAKQEPKEEPKEVELSEEVKPIKHNPEGKPQKEINLYATKRQMTTKDRVFNKLFNS